MISQARTLGVFQIESPGQRELVGKSGIETFEDIITDISLFRPGPVKSDMITPYLEAKHGWTAATYLHDDLRPILGETNGVVVFHEQVIEMIARFARHHQRRGRREAARARRRRGDGRDQALVLPGRARPRLLPAGGRGGLEGDRGVRVVRLLQGPRRGVRAADLPVGLAQGPLAGPLPGRRAHPRPRHVPQAADPRGRPPVRHRDPRPRRQRQREAVRRRADVVARRAAADRARARPRGPTRPSAAGPTAGPGASGWRWPRSRASTPARSSGSSRRRPYHSLTDFWHRAQVSRPIAERLVLAGAFDSVYGIGSPMRWPSPASVAGPRSPGATCCSRSPSSTGTRGRSSAPAGPAGWPRGRRGHAGAAAGRRAGSSRPPPAPAPTRGAREGCGRRSSGIRSASQGVWAKAAAQSRAAADPRPVTSVQLTLDLGDEPQEQVSGLPEMTRRGADARRAGDPRPRRQPARRRHLRRRSSTPSARSAARTSSASAAGPRSWSPGSRSPPRPRRSGPGAGWCS